MSLSVAEIERWDADDVRAVFRAATRRAQAASDAADGLADLAALPSWAGESAAGARAAIARIRADLDSHGHEALAVADAARLAADSIEAIHADLAELKNEAAGWGLEVDASTDGIVTVPGSRPVGGCWRMGPRRCSSG